MADAGAKTKELVAAFAAEAKHMAGAAAKWGHRIEEGRKALAVRLIGPDEAPAGPETPPLLAKLGRRPEGMERKVSLDRLGAFFFWLMVGMFGAFFVWMNVATLDIVSMTTGEIIPSSQVKTIQHLEGGIVLEIAVREGQKVEKGQPLVTLENTSSGADVAELEIRLGSLSIDVTRLEAEAALAPDVNFTAEQLEKFPELTKQAQERFKTRRRTHESKIVSQQQAIKQRQNEIKEIQARLYRNREALVLHEEQVKISDELLKDNLTNRLVHIDLLKRLTELKGAIEQDTAALARVNAALEEANSTLVTIQSSFAEDVRAELNGTILEVTELTERQKKYQDSLRRTVLRSPVDGIVKTLHITTIGGVIRAGDKVVDIVPGEDRLIVEAKLPTTDIGFVQTGQAATIKLTSADAARYGQLEGVVVNVSPDTILSPDGVPYYKVRVETERSYFERGRWRYYLFPGMRVMANIHTGERTVFQYLFDPFIASMGNALHER